MVLLLLCGLGRRADAADDLALHYDVYWLMLRIVSVDVASRVDGSGYGATVDFRTAGLLDTFAPWQSRIMVGGIVDGTVLRPSSYRVESALGDRHQSIALEYERAGTVRGAVEGILTDGERDNVPAPLRDGTVDPVTASVLVTERLARTGSCEGTVRIFDGLRRYDLRYDDLGPADLEPSGRDPYRGSARHCRATVDPIAGFLRTGDHAGERATAISAWMAAPLPGAPPVTVRMDVVGERGTLHVHLARATARP
jgi:hypothetical protein